MNRTSDAPLRNVQALLVDFDGPMCSVFSAESPRDIADSLCAAAAARFDVQLPSTRDPLALLRAAGEDNADLALFLDDQLTEHEVRGVSAARPTEGALDLLSAASVAGLGIAIVSNNASAAIQRFLRQQGVDELISSINGRIHGRPDLMKPNPFVLTAALHALGQDAADSLTIGDSVSDIDAARAIGSLSVGYANKLGKAERLRTAGATHIVVRIPEVNSLLGLPQHA